MTGHFRKAFKGRDGFSRNALDRKVLGNREAPEEVVEFVLNDTKLPVKAKTNPEPYRVVCLGLAALEGKPAPETPAEFAEVLRSELPTAATALKVADALAKQGWPCDTVRAQREALASSVVSSLGSLLTTLASIVGKLDRANGKLDIME